MDDVTIMGRGRGGTGDDCDGPEEALRPGQAVALGHLGMSQKGSPRAGGQRGCKARQPHSGGIC